MKAILKLKNKKIYLDWEFGYSKVPYWIKALKSKYSNVLFRIYTSNDNRIYIRLSIRFNSKKEWQT